MAKRAMIRENASTRTLIISSRASCPVATIHTFPRQTDPNFSIKDCKLRSILVFVTRVRAYIWPKGSLKDQYAPVKEQLKQTVKEEAVKLK